MPLSRPLEFLLARELAMILAVLAGAERPLTGRRISALTGTVSQPTTSRLLIDLVRRGLVMKVPGGYELNREHLAYQAVEALLGARDELRHRVAEEVALWDPAPLSVVLLMAGAPHDDQTGDNVGMVAVRPSHVPPDDLRWSANLAHLCERVGRWCGTPCDVLAHSTDDLAELQRVDDPLITTLLRDGVTCAGAHPATLLR